MGFQLHIETLFLSCPAADDTSLGHFPETLGEIFQSFPRGGGSSSKGQLDTGSPVCKPRLCVPVTGTCVQDLYRPPTQLFRACWLHFIDHASGSWEVFFLSFQFGSKCTTILVMFYPGLLGLEQEGVNMSSDGCAARSLTISLLAHLCALPPSGRQHMSGSMIPQPHSRG